MAEFNPQISPLTENFKDYSRIVEAPHIAPGTSTGTMLETIGKGIGGAFKIADDFMQQKVKNEATEGVDAIRDITTRTLETATQPQSVVPGPAETGDGTKVADPSLLDTNAAADVPEAIDGGLKRIGTLTNARMATSGRNDTIYVQQLNSLAKNLRAQYPGYRSYIDEQISSMTGMNPANAYVNSLLADYKANQGSVEKIWLEAYSDVRKSAGMSVDKVSSDQMTQFLLANRNNPAAIQKANEWLYKVNADKATADHQTAVLTAGKQNDEELKSSVTTLFNTNADNKFNNHFYTNTVISGVSASKIGEQITEAGIRPGTHSATEQQDMAQTMAAKRDAFEAELRYDASQLVRDPRTGKLAVDSRGNNYSPSSLLGAESEAIIQRKLAGYNTVINAVTNKETGTALYSATYGQRVRADVDAGIITDDQDKALLKTEWMGKNMPPGLQNRIIEQALKSGVDDKFNNLFTEKTKNIFVPSNLKNGEISTFKKDVQEAITGEKTSGKPISAESKFYDKLVDNIQFLGDPKVDDKSKMAVADYYFRPEGRHILQDFKQGFWTDATGKIIPGGSWWNLMPGSGAKWTPGREAVWDKLTDPQVTTVISRLPARIQKNYVDWAEAEHGQMVTTEIKNLNRFQDNTSGIHLKYNADTANFTFVDKNENVIRPNMRVGITTGNTPQDIQQNYLYRSQGSLDRLNEVGKNMKQIQDSLGNKQGMSAYCLDLLQRQGFRPNENLKGMDQKFYDAIAASHRVNRIEDVFKNELNNNP